MDFDNVTVCTFRRSRICAMGCEVVEALFFLHEVRMSFWGSYSFIVGRVLTFTAETVFVTIVGNPAEEVGANRIRGINSM